MASDSQKTDQMPLQSTQARQQIGANSAFNASAHPDEDWTKISDLAERRRVQNRIAQRNYRKRIKERMQFLESKAAEKGSTETNNITSTRNAPIAFRRPDGTPIKNVHGVADGVGDPEPQRAVQNSKQEIPSGKEVPNANDEATGKKHTPHEDYVMQLALLEKQNNKRLMMALQRHDGGADDVRSDGQDAPSRAARYSQPTLAQAMRSAASPSSREMKQSKQTDPATVGSPVEEDMEKQTQQQEEREEQSENHQTSPRAVDSSPFVAAREAGSSPLLEPSLSTTRPSRDLKILGLLHDDFVDSSDFNLGTEDVEQKMSGTLDARLEGKQIQLSSDQPETLVSLSDKSGRQEGVYKALRLETVAASRRYEMVGEKFGITDPTAFNDEKFATQKLGSQFKNTPFAEVPHSLHSDDDMSLGSFVESVFDTGSIVSSASSFHSNSQVLVASFVDLLVDDPTMDNLLATATSEFDISSGKFTRNFSKILESYSRHLRQTVESSFKDKHEVYSTAIQFIRNARHQIANLIASRYNERAPTARVFKNRDVEIFSSYVNHSVPADDDDLCGNEESSENEMNFDVGEVKHFLVSGEPFGHLKRNLRSLIVPDEFLHCIYESTRELLDLILADRRTSPLAAGLCHASTAGKDMSSDLASSIRIMADRLKIECTDIPQLDAANFLEIYARYISVVAIDHVKGTLITSDADVEDASRSSNHGKTVMKNVAESDTTGPNERTASPAPLLHEQVLEQIVVDTLPLVHYVDLVAHRNFLASSAAFASFIDDLHDLVHPSFFSEARKLLKKTILSAEASGDRSLASEGQRLLPILAEMQSCFLKDYTVIRFFLPSDEIRPTMLDKAKLAIEASTAAEWDWWPLQPPSLPENPGKSRVSWQCSCGTKRYESTLPYYAIELQSIHDNYPMSPDGGTAMIGRSKSSLSNASSQGASSVQSTKSSSTNISNDLGASTSLSSTSSSFTASDGGGDSFVNLGTSSRKYIYVFLLVKASEYALGTIDVSSMKARDFFKTLRATYHDHRGFWRRIFSIFVYHHCDFVKIVRPEPDTLMHSEQQCEFPSVHDNQYHYEPKPTTSPLITKHMFRHYFYCCYDSGSLSHRLHSCLPLVPTCRIRNPASQLLEQIPKRDRPFEVALQSDKVEVCYGLVAREYRSFLHVITYLCLSIAPAFWFTFAWIFQWGSRDDLQDATVPMTLMLAALSLLWAVVYSGSDVRRQYGQGLD